MKGVSIYPLIADGLSKWCWFHRGNNLYCRARGKRFFLCLSRYDGKNWAVCELQINKIKEEIIIPSIKEIDKIIDKFESKYYSGSEVVKRINRESRLGGEEKDG